MAIMVPVVVFGHRMMVERWWRDWTLHLAHTSVSFDAHLRKHKFEGVPCDQLTAFSDYWQRLDREEEARRLVAAENTFGGGI